MEPHLSRRNFSMKRSDVKMVKTEGEWGVGERGYRRGPL
jgi:hypothetical protein